MWLAAVVSILVVLPLLGPDLIYESAKILFQEELVRVPKLQCAALCLRSQINKHVSSGHVSSHAIRLESHLLT